MYYIIHSEVDVDLNEVNRPLMPYKEGSIFRFMKQIIYKYLKIVFKWRIIYQAFSQVLHAAVTNGSFLPRHHENLKSKPYSLSSCSFSMFGRSMLYILVGNFRLIQSILLKYEVLTFMTAEHVTVD